MDNSPPARPHRAVRPPRESYEPPRGFDLPLFGGRDRMQAGRVGLFLLVSGGAVVLVVGVLLIALQAFGAQ